MSITETYEPIVRRDHLERLELLDDWAPARTQGSAYPSQNDWHDLHEQLQADLAVLDQTVLGAVKNARVHGGSNRSNAWILFSYRVYEPALETGIDPVVVGITISVGQEETFLAQGDICGETTGDVIYEESPRPVIGNLAAVEAAHSIRNELTRRADLVIAALQNLSRQA